MYEKYGLVDISKLIPSIVLDIRYATTNNFLGVPLYQQPKCLMHKDTADAILKVQKRLKAQGLGLKIYDGYRPLSVQQKMWDLIQDERYVANPKKGKTRHPRGTAIDATLVDLLGNELEMPTEFDDFTERAHSHYNLLSEKIINHRRLLKNVMSEYNLVQVESEWWHFDLLGWENEILYPVLDIPL